MLLQGFAVLKAELQERKAQPTGLIRLATTLGFGRLGLSPVLAAFQVRHADQCGCSASARLLDRAKKRAR
jgi:DNA-binding transcriptional LysR family regulator